MNTKKNLTKYLILLPFLTIVLATNILTGKDYNTLETSFWVIRLTEGVDYQSFSYFVQKTNDGGFFFGGVSNDTNEWVTRAVIIKMDGDLNIQWQKKYNSTYESYFSDVKQTSDGGYILTGIVDLSTYLSSPFVIKLDQNGDIIWQKAIYSSGGEAFNNIQQTSDGGYIICGAVIDSYNWTDAWVIKLDSNGNIQWQKAIGSSNIDEPLKIKEVTGGYMMIGGTSSYQSLDLWLVKFDTSGNVLWQKMYAGPEYHNELDKGYNLIELSDGNFILAGTTISWEDQNSLWIIKIDPSGDIIWQKRIYPNVQHMNADIVKTSDGNYVLASTVFSEDTFSNDIWIGKMNPDGELLWQRLYGEDYDENMHALNVTPDGGFLLANDSNSYSEGWQDFLIMKLKDDGTSSTACPYLGDTVTVPIDTEGRVVTLSETPYSPTYTIENLNISFTNANMNQYTICSTCTEPSFNGVETVSDPDICENTGIQITWQEPSSWGLGATSGVYDIYRYEDSSCSGTSTQVADNLPANQLSFTDTTTSVNTTYYYQVVACNNCTPSLCYFGATNCSNAVVDKEAINPVVSNNLATDDDLCEDTGVLVTWSTPSNWGDNDYNTEARYIDVLRDGTPIASSLPPTTTNYLDTTGENNTTYNYQVRFTNGCNLYTVTTGYNAADMVATEPSGLPNNTASDISHCTDTGVLISWFAPSNWGDNGYGTRKFEVLRNGEVIATLGVLQWTYTDTTGTNGVYYTYTVRYINGCNLSATTSPGAQTADLIPSNPSGLQNNTATDANQCADTGVTITWAKDPSDWGDHNEGTRTYDILRNGTPIATGIAYGTTSYNDNTGTNGVSYTYTVRYNNGCGLSSTTSPGAQAADMVPTNPSGLSNNTAADIDQCADTGVLITWAQDPSNWGDNNVGTRTYNVLRNGNPIATGLSYGTTTYTDNTGTNGVSYTYTIQYVNGCSLTATTSPGAQAADLAASNPSGLSNNTAADYNACQDSGVIITWAKDPTNWNDNNIGTRTYDVLRDGIPIATGLTYGTTSFIDTTGTNDIMYNYRVRYNNGCNLSTTTSPGANARDQVGSTPTVNNNNTAADVSGCADSGVLITWSADPTNWRDNNYNPSLRTYDILRDGEPIVSGLTYGTTNFTDTTGINGQTYTYSVRYNNSCLLSNSTAGVAAADLIPSSPTGLTNNTAADTNACEDTGVTISWTQDPTNWGDNNTGNRTYDILRNGSPIATGIAYGTTTYNDNTGTNGVSYTYTVRYNNGCSLSATTSPGQDASDLVAQAPSGLSNNTAADVDSCADTGVFITWNQDPTNWGDNNIGSRSYQVLRNGNPIATINYPATNYTDTTGTNNTTYTYTIRYINGCNLSNTTSPGAQAADLVASQPSGLTNNTATDVSPCEATGIQITWTADPSNWGDNNIGTRTYDILRNSTPIATGLPYGTTSYIDETAVAGTTYTYQVRYNNGCGLSNTTTGAQATDQQASPPNVPNITAADINGCEDTGVLIQWPADAISWNDNNYGTRTYDVLRDGTPIATGLPYGTTNYTDNTGNNQQTYNYSVRYNNGCGLSNTTVNVQSADMIGTQPTGLSNNSATDINACEDTGVLITWAQDPTDWGDNSTGTRTYDILRNGTPIATNITYGTTSYTDNTGLNNTTYLYTIRYNNGCSLSNITDPGQQAADITATSPSNLNNNNAVDADPCLASGIIITWEADPDNNSNNWGDNGQGTRTYDILRNGTPIATGLPYPNSTYTDTTATPGTTYTYTVRYNNGCGLSSTTSPGADAADLSDTIPCSEIGNRLFVSKSGSDVIINWSSYPGCADLANYNVYASTAYNSPFPSNWTIIGTPTSTSYSDPLTSSFIAYKVLAIDLCGNPSNN